MATPVKKDSEQVFRFKQFAIRQDKCQMKIGTDGVLLGAWAPVEGVRQALDIGTGSGVIAVMLAQRLPEATIHGVEIDDASAEQARDNMADCPWAERLAVFHESIQEFARQSSQTYDLIVSNPPFFTGGTFSHDHNRNHVRHTVKLPHADLLTAVRQLLAREGRFCLILPLIEGMRFCELAGTFGFHCTRRMEVRPRKDKPVERLLLQFERQPRPLSTESLVIQHEGRNEWTAEYIALTGDFYLKM